MIFGVREISCSWSGQRGCHTPYPGHSISECRANNSNNYSDRDEHGGGYMVRNPDRKALVLRNYFYLNRLAESRFRCLRVKCQLSPRYAQIRPEN